MGKSLYYGFPGKEWARQVSKFKMNPFESFQRALSLEATWLSGSWPWGDEGRGVGT